MRRLSVIVPVYNEESTLALLLDRVAAAPLSVDRQIVIVDDGSQDRSPEIAEEWRRSHPDLDVLVLRVDHGGKGSAVRSGVAASTGDVVIVQDADLEYDPRDYQRCIDPILRGESAVVYGSRELSGTNRRHSSRVFYLGGRLVSAFFNLLYRTALTDVPTCYKAFRGDLIRALPWISNGFAWEPEITAKLLRLGVPIREVPIAYHPRTVSEGKKIRYRDGITALWTALLWRFRNPGNRDIASSGDPNGDRSG